MKTQLKAGYIRRYNTRTRSGYIIPDDGSKEIYFDSNSFSEKLKQPSKQKPQCFYVNGLCVIKARAGGYVVPARDLALHPAVSSFSFVDDPHPLKQGSGEFYGSAPERIQYPTAR